MVSSIELKLLGLFLAAWAAGDYFQHGNFDAFLKALPLVFISGFLGLAFQRIRALEEKMREQERRLSAHEERRAS
jgi:hypothetical protein